MRSPLKTCFTKVHAVLAAQVSIAEEVQTAPVSGDDPDADRVYEMTGQTGSLCYMAPEVLLGCFYNQKARGHYLSLTRTGPASQTLTTLTARLS